MTFTLAGEASLVEDWGDYLYKMWDVEDLSRQADEDDDDDLWLD